MSSRWSNIVALYTFLLSVWFGLLGCTHGGGPDLDSATSPLDAIIEHMQVRAAGTLQLPPSATPEEIVRLRERGVPPSLLTIYARVGADVPWLLAFPDGARAVLIGPSDADPTPIDADDEASAHCWPFAVHPEYPDNPTALAVDPAGAVILLGSSSPKVIAASIDAFLGQELLRLKRSDLVYDPDYRHLVPRQEFLEREKLVGALAAVVPDAPAVLEAWTNHLTRDLVQQDQVTLPPLGAFSVSQRRPMVGVGPKTGDERLVPPLKSPRFGVAPRSRRA